MKVTVPEGPMLSYELLLKDKEFKYTELVEMLGKAEADIDKICETLAKSDEVYIFCYQMLFYKDFEHFLGEIMSGGFDLSVKEARKYSLPSFQRRYKSSFKNVLEELKEASYPITVDISLTGFNDKTTRQIDALDPRKP